MNPSPGSELRREEFEEALRIERLLPMEQMRHPNTIRADPTKFVHVNSCGKPPWF